MLFQKFLLLACFAALATSQTYTVSGRSGVDNGQRAISFEIQNTLGFDVRIAGIDLEEVIEANTAPRRLYFRPGGINEVQSFAYTAWSFISQTTTCPVPNGPCSNVIGDTNVVIPAGQKYGFVLSYGTGSLRYKDRIEDAMFTYASTPAGINLIQGGLTGWGCDETSCVFQARDFCGTIRLAGLQEPPVIPPPPAPFSCPITLPSSTADDACTLDINVLPTTLAEVDGWSSLFVPSTDAFVIGSSVTKGGVTFTLVDSTVPYTGAATLPYTSTGVQDTGSNPSFVGISVVGLPTGTYDVEVFAYSGPSTSAAHNIYLGPAPAVGNVPSNGIQVTTTGDETPGTFQFINNVASATYVLAAQSTSSTIRSTLNAFSFRARDTQPPAMTCPAPLVVELDQTCSASIGQLCPAVTDECFGASVSGDAPSEVLFSAPTSVRYTFQATDTSGNTASCNTEVLVADVIPPELLGNCPTEPIVLNSDSGLCGALYTLPSSDLSATDNCAPQPLLQYTIPSQSGFAASSGIYDPASPTAVTLPVGTYQLSIYARQPANAANGQSGLSSTRSCPIDVTVTDIEPPTVCIPAHDVTLPCGGQSLNGWLQNAGWPIVKDNCGVARGSFVAEPAMDMYCGEAPVRVLRSFNFTDLGGQSIRVGNVHYDTADASCTCDYLRPFEYFDTQVNTASGVISPANVAYFPECSVPGNVQCWCSGYGFHQFLNKKICRGLSCNGLAFERTDDWYTSPPYSAGLTIPGDYISDPKRAAPVYEFVFLESPLLNLTVLRDFENGLTQPIVWDQKVDLPYGQGYAFAFVSFYQTCGSLCAPTRLYDVAIPAYYVTIKNLTAAACTHSTPFGSSGPVLFWGQNECQIELSTKFWPDLVEYIQYVLFHQSDSPVGKKRSMAGESPIVQRFNGVHSYFAELKKKRQAAAGPYTNLPDLSTLPQVFKQLNAPGPDGDYPLITNWASLVQYTQVKLAFAVHVNGGNPDLAYGHSRSGPVQDPPVPPDRHYYVDTIRFGNTGYRFNISDYILSA